MANRTTTLNGWIWARTAPDVPGGTPATNVTYARSGLSQEDLERGWPYGGIPVPSDFENEVKRRITILLALQEHSPFLPWCATVTYAAADFVLGTNGWIYYAKGATTGNDPVSSPTYWGALYSPGYTPTENDNSKKLATTEYVDRAAAAARITTTSTQAVGNNSTLLSNTAYVDRAVGIAQTLTDVTASRALGAVYTNSTGVKLPIFVTVNVAAGQSAALMINGHPLDVLGDAATVGTGMTFYVEIKPGYTYQVTASGGSNISSWWEDR